MIKNSLFDALEICLQALDQGEDVESCLARFPAQADDLRPILTAAIQARSASAPETPVDVARRGRARVLQAAAGMREQRRVAAVVPFWRPAKKGFFGARFFRLALTTAIMLVFLLTGGTGLVNASSNALPGDQLYPIKRSWEGLQLFLVIDSNAKVELEHEFDHKRVLEIEELYSEKRVARVDFQGVVQSRANNLWVVGGLDIAVDEETTLGANILSGATVQVIGETDDGIIVAEKIILIAAPVVIPTSEDSPILRETAQPDDSHKPEATEMHENDAAEQEDSAEKSKSTPSPDGEHELKPGESQGQEDNKSSDGGSEENNDDGSEKDGGDNKED
jgi:hypothetical protein